MTILHTSDEIRNSVRERYAQVATKDEHCGCGTETTCCNTSDAATADKISATLGYSAEEISAIPAGANLGLGCGNPQAIANLQEGETVLDLGSGGGFDCFLAARQVGSAGKVIGVDMTFEMVMRARANAATMNARNTEFRLGEIEHLPVADSSIDCIISNCVINLSPDKQQVFHEAYRVLKHGGRIAVSDVVETAPLPDEWKNDSVLHSKCALGAGTVEEVEMMLHNAGFRAIRIVPKDESKEFIRTWDEKKNIQDYIVSAHIEAIK
jgi:SAM-dependent methyltransferase